MRHKTLGRHCNTPRKCSLRKYRDHGVGGTASASPGFGVSTMNSGLAIFCRTGKSGCQQIISPDFRILDNDQLCFQLVGQKRQRASALSSVREGATCTTDSIPSNQSRTSVEWDQSFVGSPPFALPGRTPLCRLSSPPSPGAPWLPDRRSTWGRCTCTTRAPTLVQTGADIAQTNSATS